MNFERLPSGGRVALNHDSVGKASWEPAGGDAMPAELAVCCVEGEAKAGEAIGMVLARGLRRGVLLGGLGLGWMGFGLTCLRSFWGRVSALGFDGSVGL